MTTNYIDFYQTMPMIEKCDYDKVCTDKGEKCDSCKHLPKKSYYEPEDTWTITTGSC